jgi:lysozyme family protein
MIDRIDSIINAVLEREGSTYTNDPRDSGGPTKWGVTQDTLSQYLGHPATEQDVQELDHERAFGVYYTQYVRKPRFDEIAEISPPIAEELIDTGVNCGTAVAAMFLQRALNALNLSATRYPDLDVDGNVGGGTLSALQTYLAWRGAEGESVLLTALNCLQGERYIELAEKRPKDEAYVYGWLRARVRVST